MQANGRLQIGLLQRLAEGAAEFAIEADIDLRVRQPGNVGKMRPQRKRHIDLGADSLAQPHDLREIGGHVEAP